MAPKTAIRTSFTDTSVGKATPSTDANGEWDEMGFRFEVREETGLQLELMPIEAFLFSRPINEDHEHNRRDRPISDRPIENGFKFFEYLYGKLPDFVHVTTSGKGKSRASQA